jgi:hypothetical protein
MDQQPKKSIIKRSINSSIVPVLGLALLIGALFVARKVLPLNFVKAASPTSVSLPGKIDFGAGNELDSGSGENVARPDLQGYVPVQPTADLSKDSNLTAAYVLDYGSGENVIRPDILVHVPVQLPAGNEQNSGSGENVVRPDTQVPVLVQLPVGNEQNSGSGENVVRPDSPR